MFFSLFVCLFVAFRMSEGFWGFELWKVGLGRLEISESWCKQGFGTLSGLTAAVFFFAFWFGVCRVGFMLFRHVGFMICQKYQPVCLGLRNPICIRPFLFFALNPQTQNPKLMTRKLKNHS